MMRLFSTLPAPHRTHALHPPHLTPELSEKANKPDRKRCACLTTAGYLREQRDISFQDGPVLDSKPYRVSVA
jgi:hypothetical protein